MIHNHKWTPLIHNLLKGHGCPKCGTIKSNLSGDKSLDFVGWTSEDGLLQVTGVESKEKYEMTRYRVKCKICSKDKELFPDGYFVSTKHNLMKGKKPCGCSKSPKFDEYQYLILLNRISEGKFKIKGFEGKFEGINTKVRCECLVDEYTWLSGISPLLRGHGCPKCAIDSRKEKRKIPENIALQNCIDICKEEGYEPLGFPSGYENSNSSFEYVCPKHGKQKVTYTNFTKPKGTRCPYCIGTKKKPDIFIKDILERCLLDNYTFIGFQKRVPEQL